MRNWDSFYFTFLINKVSVGVGFTLIDDCAFVQGFNRRLLIKLNYALVI